MHVGDSTSMLTKLGNQKLNKDKLAQIIPLTVDKFVTWHPSVCLPA